MKNPNSISLWEGKVQLGDEPGIYGNAAYSGIGIIYPLTILNIDPTHPQQDVLKLEILTSAVNVFQGYPGHNAPKRSMDSGILSTIKWITLIAALKRSSVTSCTNNSWTSDNFASMIGR